MPETRWGISLGPQERMELERIVLDRDEAAALRFLEEHIYPRIAEWEKDPHGCLHVALDRQEQEREGGEADEGEEGEGAG